ncbi:aldehyde dehydrogenase [Paracoccus versutus]|uniref:aldehyde dehydrogenase (NAD(+)) n=1 Tax=Paracoccus versutus TaxID=34007 RepID=A0AAQ0KJC7_PARVE|nr:aldehyde dehydrogenase [Paracoccus versutus]KGJ05081.1 aldehyde dehydrogenase [Paracoccus versutus]REG29275.1 betaine-aldehyde dehydrogenase [Paracoccus versutus]WEJ79623.1 aldehyde dehydrogenase [Paracoccus versutus]
MIWQGRTDRLFIGGEWVAPSSGTFVEVISPMTEEPVASVVSGDRADADRAVAAARMAFDHGPWPRMALAERIEVLARLRDLIAERQDLIARLVTAENGCPISTSQWMQAAGPRVLMDVFFDLAPQYPFSDLRHTPLGNGLVLREPMGVVAAVVPWNAPLLLAILKMTPALLCGNTVILKPAPETPVNAYLLAELVQQAGLPPGTVNVLPADRETSEYLCLHPGVDKVSFTGSTAAGQRLGGLCGQEIRRITLELGGKSAAIILDDADIPKAVENLRLASLRNSGQVCSNKTRILVPRRRRDEILDALTAMVGTMPVGDPMDPATEIGPMVSARQRDRVEGYVARGRAEGATLVLGGGRPGHLGHGWFVEPTIFADVDQNATIAQEEIFGPVLAVLNYDSEDEAVAIANNSQYGLHGSVFSGDDGHAVAVARRIRTGSVDINGAGAGFYSPLGGFKKSGIGREAAIEGFDAYVEMKSIGLPAAYAETFA